MIATQVASPFLTPFKLSIYSAFFLAMPVILHQIWAFVSPGLYLREKRFAMPLLVSSIVFYYLRYGVRVLPGVPAGLQVLRRASRQSV